MAGPVRCASRRMSVSKHTSPRAAGTRQWPRRTSVCGDGQPRSPPSRKGTITVTPPEAAVRHDPADQVGEDPTAGADEARAYRDFWADVGSTFPDLHGARSTAQYLEDEQWLFQTHLAPLEGLRILKTDLWDEAKNTRILGWAAEAGSRAFGVDISPGIVRDARRNFEERSLTLHGVLVRCAGAARSHPGASTRSTPWGRLSTSRTRTGPYGRFSAWCGRVAAWSSGCRIAGTPSCARSWWCCCTGSGCMGTASRSRIRGAPSGGCSRGRALR